MSTLYVVEQGATVRRRGARLVVTKFSQKKGEEPREEKLADVPVIKVTQVVIMGNVSLTTPVLALVMERGIDVVFLSRYGKFRGRLVGRGSGFGALRMAQYRAVTDFDYALGVAKQVVRGKLLNQRTLLARYHGRAPQPEVARAVGRIDELGRSIGRKRGNNALMGIEGAGAAAFFEGLRALVPPEWEFTRRARRPPPDPLNALLSLGYTLLGNVLYAAVALTGLDPYLGFFHVERYNRPGLMLDLIEEFRPAVVDWLVLRVVRTGILTLQDFVWDTTGEARLPVQLTEEARKRYIAEFEQRLNTRVIYPPTAERNTWRRCMELQARQVARGVQTRASYEPLLLAQAEDASDVGGGEL